MAPKHGKEPQWHYHLPHELKSEDQEILLELVGVTGRKGLLRQPKEFEFLMGFHPDGAKIRASVKAWAEKAFFEGPSFASFEL